MRVTLKAIPILALTLLPALAYAGFGGMGNVETNDVGSVSGGSLLIAVIGVFALLGGIGWYCSRSEDEAGAFAQLAAIFFCFVVVATIVTNCTK